MFTYKNCLKKLTTKAFFLLSSSVCDDVACEAEGEPRVWVPGLVCTSQVHGRTFPAASRLVPSPSLEQDGEALSTLIPEIGRASCRERVSSPV